VARPKPRLIPSHALHYVRRVARRLLKGGRGAVISGRYNIIIIYIQLKTLKKKKVAVRNCYIVSRALVYDYRGS